MSTSVEALTSPGPQPLERDARPGLARLTRVELRKMVDTRSGFWLLMAVVALTLLTIVISLIANGPLDHSFRNVLSNAVQAALALVPVVGILLVTAEWSQRTGLVSFALVPGRSRVILAKVLAGILLALAALALALVLTAVGVAIAAPDIADTWTLPLSIIGQDGLYAVLAMLTGLAFGTAFLSSAPAIVLYFGLPIAIGALGSISAISGTMEWIETGALAPLTEEVVSGRDWAQMLTATLLWTVLPLAIGLWRIRRNEVK